LTSFLACGAANASVGYVQFASGEVRVKGVDGVERLALKGMELNTGDTVATGGGRAQLRFSDGAYVSLQPESVFRIDEYRYEGKPDGTEKGFFSLLKGGVRTITGWVGRLNRDNYQVVTPAATIGIRGTEYLAALGDSLTVSVGEGRVAVINRTGEFLVEAGQSAYVADRDSRPAVTSDKPFLPPDPVKEGLQPPVLPGFKVTDVVNSSGVPVVLPAGAAGETFIVAKGAGLRPNNGVAMIDVAGLGSPTCTAAGACDRLKIGALNLNNVSAEVLDSGFDQAVGWGRWSNGVFTAGGVGNVQVGATQGLHYVYGVPTLPANLPTGTATYSVVGATQATSSDGSLGLGAFSGTLAGGNVLRADFTAGTVNVGFQVDFGSNGVYAVNNQQLSLSGATFSGAGLAATGPSCAGAGCTGSVNGFFAGPAAERAGLGYQISDPNSLTISGAAALAKN
jgi:hypothetical protein